MTPNTTISELMFTRYLTFQWLWKQEAYRSYTVLPENDGASINFFGDILDQIYSGKIFLKENKLYTNNAFLLFHNKGHTLA